MSTAPILIRIWWLQMSHELTQLDRNTLEKRNNKDKEKQDAADDAMKVRCKICFKEVFPVRRCGGHGGGSGGGGSAVATDERSSDTSDLPSDLLGTKSAAITPALDIEVAVTSSAVSSSDNLQSDDELFDAETISELLFTKLLIIENDSEKGVLTIKLQCFPKELSEEQRNKLKKFIAAIMHELTEFEKENGISEPCNKVSNDQDGNLLSLRICVPKPSLFDAFIQRLNSKHLLPIYKMEHSEYLNTKEDLFNPRPCSLTPTPIDRRTTRLGKEHHAELAFKEGAGLQSEEEFFRPNPFTINLKPKE